MDLLKEIKLSLKFTSIWLMANKESKKNLKISFIIIYQRFGLRCQMRKELNLQRLFLIFTKILKLYKKDYQKGYQKSLTFKFTDLDAFLLLLCNSRNFVNQKL